MTIPRPLRAITLPSLLLSSAVLISACYGPPPGAPPPGGGPQGPVPVGVVTLKQQAVPLSTELPGRTTPYRVAEVRPQVSGVVLKRLFVEGAEVQAGDALYQIDPAPFQAKLASAKAALDRAQATLTSARLTAARNQTLAEAKAISQQDYDDSVAAQSQAAADVASARAAVDTARIDLAYTKVVSPISGRSGRSSVTEGALVTASQAAALVTVQQLDPIYVDVTQSSAALLRLRSELESGHLMAAGDDAAAVQLKLEDGSDYAQPGRLQFSEVTVDPATGAVTLRAQFPNPDSRLLPGMFVHARLQEGVRQALLVPQQGVTRTPEGEATALVVGAGNKVEMRAIKAQRAVGADWLVESGLEAGDQVIVSGVQKIKPGTQVTANEMPSDTDLARARVASTSGPQI